MSAGADGYRRSPRKGSGGREADEGGSGVLAVVGGSGEKSYGGGN